MRVLLLAVAVLAGTAADPAGRLEQIQQELTLLPRLVPSAQTHQRIGFHCRQQDGAFVAIDFGRTVIPDRIAIFPARLPHDVGVPSPGFPAGFDLEIAATADFARAVRIARWREETPGAGEQVPFLVFPGNGASGRHLRLRVTARRDGADQEEPAAMRLGEIVVLQDGLNVALQCPVTSSDATESARRWERLNLVDGNLWCVPLRGAGTSPSNGFLSAVSRDPVVADRTWVEVDLGEPLPIDQVHLVPAHPRDFPDSAGFGFPSHFRILADPGTANEHLVVKELEPPFPAEALPNPGEGTLMIATPGLIAQRIRVTCQALWRRGPGSDTGNGEHVFALAELQVWHGRTNLAVWRRVLASDSSQDAGWSPEALTDGHSSRQPLLDWERWLDGLERAERLRHEAAVLEITSAAQREGLQRRVMLVAILAVAAIGLLAAGMVLRVRVRARREQEALRQRIARDLHDEIGAGLSHLAMQSDLARREQATGAADGGRLEHIAAGARDLIDHMRDAIWLLTPTTGDWEALSKRMAGIAERLLDGIPHQVRISGTPPAGTPPIATAREVVLMLKEVLTNARRHSGAESVQVSLHWGDRLELTVRDDGRGFDHAAAGTGHGLDNLRQRAAALGAKLTIDSNPGAGTAIHLLIPLEGGAS